jgi:hypothetical protein
VKVELSTELAERLIAACPKFLHHNQVALSCGVTPSTLQMWLTRGLTSPEEPYASFAERYYAADMTYCETKTRALFDEETEPALLRLLWEWHAARWPATEAEASILPLSETKATKRRSMVESLRNPTPELASIIAEAGLAPLVRDSS